MRRLKRLAGNLLLAIASTAATLVALEVYCRLRDLRGFHEHRSTTFDLVVLKKPERVPGVKVQVRPYAVYEHRYDSNPRGYFDANDGIVYTTNRWGFRGPDFDIARRAGTMRVMVLGDSFTVGEGVKLEDTFCTRLEPLLSARSGRPVEVLRVAVSGWGTTDEIAYYEQVAVKWRPDLVIVAYVLNDAGYSGGLDLFEDFRATYEGRSLKWSYLASYVHAAWGRRSLGRRYVASLVEDSLADRAPWRRSLQGLSQGKELAESTGSDFLVCIFPFLFDLTRTYPLAPVHERVRTYCERSGIEVLDLFPAFEGRRDIDLWVHPSDQHPNAEGHRIAAEAIGQAILSRELLAHTAIERCGTVPEAIAGLP